MEMMMRNIQMVLERWGAWAASDSSGTDYSHIAAGFKGLIPLAGKVRLSCTDDDGLVIEGCMARLRAKRPDEHSLLVVHYLYGVSKRKIARMKRKDERLIRIDIQMAEGFIDGCLSMLDVRLDMDYELNA
jgi:hypothetical protein